MAGTRVNLGFVFTQPLKSAVLTFNDQTRMPLDVVGRFASVSFVHSQARSAKLQVEDVNGLALEKPHAMEFVLMAGEAQAVYERPGKRRRQSPHTGRRSRSIPEPRKRTLLTGRSKRWGPARLTPTTRRTCR